MRNVLIVHPCKGFYGGAEEVVVQLAKYLRSHGYYTSVLSKDVPGEMKAKLVASDIAITSHRSFLDMYRALKLIEHGWDVLCAFNFPASYMCLRMTRPVLWYCNEPPELFSTWWRKPLEAHHRRLITKKGPAIVVATHKDAHRVFQLYKEIAPVVPYGVDYDFWSQGTREYHPTGTFRMLQVGTVTAYKNQRRSLSTLMDLLPEGIDATLTLAGSVSDKDYVDQLVRFYIRGTKLEGRVHFLGQRSLEEVRQLYYTHDLLLHPVKEQGGWLVPFEAMCTGLPVAITSKCPAYTLIRDNSLAWTGGGLTEAAMQEYFYFREERSDRTRIKFWVRDNLTWKHFGSKMVSLLEATH